MKPKLVNEWRTTVPVYVDGPVVDEPDKAAAILAARPLTRDERGALARAVREGVARVFGGDPPAFYRAAGITRFQYSKILSHPDRCHPSKDTVLRMALALRLSPDEAAAFLALAGFALSPSHPADRVWSLCLERGLWHLPSVLRLLDKYAGSLRGMLPARQHLSAYNPSVSFITRRT